MNRVHLRRFLSAFMVFAALLSLPVAAQKKTSSTQQVQAFASLPFQDVACADGAYVTGVEYLSTSTTATIRLTCRNYISNSAGAPSTGNNLSLCQPCIPHPRGSRTLNSAQSSTQGQCVYRETLGSTCP